MLGEGKDENTSLYMEGVFFKKKKNMEEGMDDEPHPWLPYLLPCLFFFQNKQIRP
jgi:hypothetical protein